MQFELKNIPVSVYLGVPDDERETKQIICISLIFDVDTKNSEISDDIVDTVDYFEIYQHVKNFPQKIAFNLIERFYRELKNSLELTFPNIKNLKIKLIKRPFADAEVILTEK
jgi:dihydroneopterin aldolase